MDFLAEAAQLARVERFGLEVQDFARALEQSVERYAPGAAGRELREFVFGLRLEDLALAAACAGGAAAAWEEFHRTYRQYLVDAAGDAEVADQIIAELYGVGAPAGTRGRIGDFRGRSSLKGWLRAIVYQAQVDRHRRESRLTELDPETASGAAAPGREEHPEDFERRENAAALARLLGREVAALVPGERLLLGWYYQDRLRLSQIARLRGVHESTISRELDAIRTQLRKRVEKGLRAEGFSAARIEECFRHSTDAPVDFEEVFGRARNAG
ncbi:MAG TPA: sigma-70 family RNA polymerase sigma factor [Bryobacterales bacterium]|nr:sigma-70 family RNA polymerase sigma factor [Bryobacterales bacterium]